MAKINSDVLRTWKGLNELIKELTEEECWALLEEEKQGRRRISFLFRIYGRANTLRTENERQQLVNLSSTV